MELLPFGWTQVLLGDVAEIIMGQSPPSSTYNTQGRGLPFFQGKAEFGRYTPTAVKYCSLPQKIAEKDDVLISVRAPVGPTNLCMERSCIGRGLAAIRSNGTTLSKYVLYYIRSIEPWLSEQGTGSTFAAISRKHLEQIGIALAPLNEQHRIAAKLEELLAKVDKCIERLERIPAILKRFRSAILTAAFTGQLTADWRAYNTAQESSRELLNRIIEPRLDDKDTTIDSKRRRELHKDLNGAFRAQSTRNELPDTWIMCQIRDIGEVCNGSTPSRKKPEYWQGDIPWVSSGEVRNNLIESSRERITDLGYRASSVRILPMGTVLLAMIGEGKTRGQSAILRIPATINQNIAAIVPKLDLVDSQFLWYWLQYQYESNRQVGSGSGPQALNCQRVRELPVTVSPLAEQREIISKIKAFTRALDIIEARHQKAKAVVDKLTQSILAKAFRGELVPQDPNDEPASELLKRIREERAGSQETTGNGQNNRPRNRNRRKGKA